MERPLRGAPLTSLPARRGGGVLKKTLDNADDVKHGTWRSNSKDLRGSISLRYLPV